MAFTLKQIIQTTSDGTEVWIKDNTLMYDAATNPTGWGTPNPALNQTALLVYVTRKDSEGEVALTPLTSAISYNSGNANSVVQSIGLSYIQDGHYISVLMAIPVSTDGVNYLAGGAIATDEYFYMTGSIYQKQAGGGNTLITDYSLPAAADSIVKDTSEAIFFNKLSMKNMLEYYRDYRDARKGNDDEKMREIRDKMDDLKLNLTGANWLFAAALTTQAEDIVEELLEEHEIVTPSTP